MLLCARFDGRERFEADEEAAQAGGGGALDQIVAEDRVDGCGALEQPAHAAHAVEQRAAEAAIAEQVIVEEVEVAAGQPIDLGQRVVNALGVEGTAAGEERVLVAEVAVLRTTAGHDDRVGHQIVAARDQIAANRRNAVERTSRGGLVAASRGAGAEVGEESGKGLFARAEEDGVGVRRRLVRQRSDVQSAERDERAARTVEVGQSVGAVRVRDVDLDHDEVRRIVERQRLDVLVLDHGAVVRGQVGGQRGEAERRKERVFDGTPERAGGFGQGRKDELDPERACHDFAL